MNRDPEQNLIERPNRGAIHHASSIYGTSVEGVQLPVYAPDSESSGMVILATLEILVNIDVFVRCAEVP